ncbi:MAG TPA: GTPase HflX, partial [Lentisphaeria bacterium]|nr:GTPase HflX [Lentisphaeria bacterium]
NRASTQEAMLQIELAQSEYMLPRLKRAWTHLGRQRGGVGVRGGEGEKQIEIDSRLIRTRISKLKSELKAVRRRRAEQRKKRQRVPVPNSAIVG